MSLLELRARGVIAPIDHRLGEWLGQKGAPEVVQWAGALASRAVREGHVCVDLSELVGPVLDPDGVPVGMSWPSWDAVSETVAYVGTDAHLPAIEPDVLQVHLVVGLGRVITHASILRRPRAEGSARTMTIRTWSDYS